MITEPGFDHVKFVHKEHLKVPKTFIQYSNCSLMFYMEGGVTLVRVKKGQMQFYMPF